MAPRIIKTICVGTVCIVIAFALVSFVRAAETEPWRLAADPPKSPFSIPADAKLDVAVLTDFRGPSVIFPATASPMLCISAGPGVWQLWDLRTSKKTASLDTGSEAARMAAVSPDGQYLAFVASNANKPVEVWSFTTGKRACTIADGDARSIRWMAFTSVNRLLLGSPNSIVAWDVDGEKLAFQITRSDLPEQVGLPGLAAVSPGGRFMGLYFGGVGTIPVVDTVKGVLAATLRTRPDNAFRYLRCEGMAFSPDGKEVAALFPNQADAWLLVWNMTDGTLVCEQRVAGLMTQAARFVYRGAPLEWFPDTRMFLYHGRTVLELGRTEPLQLEAAGDQPRSLGFNRLVDAKRMIRVAVARETSSVQLVPIPFDSLNASRIAVQSGGKAADAGLPLLTHCDRSSAKTLSLAATAEWSYRFDPMTPPGKPFPQGVVELPNAFRSELHFSRPESGKVLVAETMGMEPQATVNRYDLRSGVCDGSCTVPSYTAFREANPEGTAIACVSKEDEGRLDLFAADDGRHLLGFRPYSHLASGGRISWTGFLSPRRLLTLSDGGWLVLWSLPECKAVYELDLRAPPAGRATFSPGRKTLAIPLPTVLWLIDAATGACQGRIDASVERATPVVSVRQLQQLAFRPDGKQLAVLRSVQQKDRISIWNLADGKMSSEMDLPRIGHALQWTADGGLLLMYRGPGWGENLTATLLDPAKGLVAWNYRIDRSCSGEHTEVSPDGNHWYSLGTGKGRLYWIAAPNAQVRQSLQAAGAPKIALAAGGKVALEFVLPDAPSKEIAAKTQEELSLYFQAMLARNRIDVSDDSELKLRVEVKRAVKRQEVGPGSFEIRTRNGRMEVQGANVEIRQDGTGVVIRSTPRATPVIRESKVLLSSVTLIDAQGKSVWQEQDSQPLWDDVSLPDDVQSRRFSMSWDAAVRWCKQQSIPKVIRYGTVNGAIGETVLATHGAAMGDPTNSDGR